ncbi:MAG: hypothetical protein GY883_16775 [Shimia sp.]|nr:hypothetical protein [Shimia sp.]
MFVKATMIRELVSQVQTTVDGLVAVLFSGSTGMRLEERAILIPVQEDRRDPYNPR